MVVLSEKPIKYSRDSSNLLVKYIDNSLVKEHIYNLRYRAYLSVNAISSNKHERFVDEYDLLPNHVLYGLYENDILIGSMRVTCLDKKSTW